MLVGLLLSLVLVATEPQKCAVVYGKSWAFISTVPQGWKSACADEALDGTALTMWPENEKHPTDGTIVYVSVSTVDPEGFDVFVKNELNGFKASSPKPEEIVLGEIVKLSESRKRVTLINGPEGRVETIVYIRDARAYYMVVMSALGSGPTSAQQKDFDSFLESFSSANLKMDNDG